MRLQGHQRKRFRGRNKEASWQVAFKPGGPWLSIPRAPHCPIWGHAPLPRKNLSPLTPDSALLVPGFIEWMGTEFLGWTSLGLWPCP